MRNIPEERLQMHQRSFRKERIQRVGLWSITATCLSYSLFELMQSFFY